MSFGSMGTCQYPLARSSVENHREPRRESIVSSMRGKGYESLMVRRLTNLKSTQRRNEPSFLVTSTTGDAQALFEDSMTPILNKRSSSHLRACPFARANRLGPSFTRSADTMVMLCWSAFVIDRSSFDLAKLSTNSDRRHSAKSLSWGPRKSLLASIRFCTCCGRVPPSSLGPSGCDWITSDTGSHVAIWVPACNLCGSLLKFMTRTGRVPRDGFSRVCATITLPSHNSWQLPSTIARVTWDISPASPGTIISLKPGITTVSAIWILKTCGMLAMYRHTWTSLPTVSLAVPTSKVHWCICRKSTPNTTGDSISATIHSCVHMSLPVPSWTRNCTVPKDSVSLPSANLILPDRSLKCTSTSDGILANTDGWTTLTVDPVSISATTDTSFILKGKYKHPIVSLSNCTSSLCGPYVW